MIERCVLTVVAVVIFGCERPQPPQPPPPVLTEEQQLREKFTNQECYLLIYERPTWKHWHCRKDCPELKAEIGDDVIPVTPVQPKINGLFDKKGFRYDLKRCSKCVY